MKKDSIVVITGANSGIGKAAAMKLAGMGAHVVMVCRSEQRGMQALGEIRSKTGGRADLMICDLADLKSVERFCESFLEKYSRLDVLVNNAGKLFRKRNETTDGYEANFQVNYLGHFLLTNRLLPAVRKSAPSRIINVSSLAHRFASLHFDDINLNKGYNWWRGYSQSKLAIVISTYSLAKKLEDTGVTVNCIHPGIVGTDILVNHKSGGGKYIAQLQKFLFMSPEKSAEPIVHLAALDEFSGVSGRYYSLGTEKSSSERSHDEEAAERLWDISEQMCYLR